MLTRKWCPSGSLILGLVVTLLTISVSWGQEEPPAPADAAEIEAKRAEAARAAEEALADAPAEDDGVVAAEPQKELNLLTLLIDGGFLMIPIAMMSILVGVFGFERFMALRRQKVIPEDLVLELGELANRKGGLDPRLAYRICQKRRSTASAVIRAALLKVGRPHSEVEKAVVEASEREAALLYKNVRPIGLAAAVTPLLGLLGTVWGMIQAFFVTAQSTTGAKAADLANGIYVALVTTLGGLSVAIVAAILSHYYEGKIQTLFRDIEDLLQSLLPQLERYEGKLRVARWEVGNSSPELEDEPEPPKSSTPAPSPTADSQPEPAPAPSK